MKLTDLKRYLPKSAVPAARLAYRVYLEGLFRYTDAKDRRVSRNASPPHPCDTGFTVRLISNHS